MTRWERVKDAALVAFAIGFVTLLAWGVCDCILRLVGKGGY